MIRLFVTIALLTTFFTLFLGCSDWWEDDEEDEALEIFEKLEANPEVNKVYLGSDIATAMRLAKANVPELSELIDIGTPAAKALVDEFDKDAVEHERRDAALTCLAILMGETNYKDGEAKLKAFVDRNDSRGELFYSLQAANLVLLMFQN